jgi:predicted ester cyclase
VGQALKRPATLEASTAASFCNERRIGSLGLFRWQPRGSAAPAVRVGLQVSDDLASNKEVVRRFMDEVSDGGNLSAIDELCAPDVINHAARAELRLGVKAFKQLMAAVLDAQADRHWTEQHYVAEGDLVVVYGIREGTWLSSRFRGIATPRQGHVSVELAHMFRVRDGRIHEHWAVRDDLGMMQQLGALDSSESARASSS